MLLVQKTHLGSGILEEAAKEGNMNLNELSSAFFPIYKRD